MILALHTIAAGCWLLVALAHVPATFRLFTGRDKPVDVFKTLTLLWGLLVCGYWTRWRLYPDATHAMGDDELLFWAGLHSSSATLAIVTYAAVRQVARQRNG